MLAAVRRSKCRAEATRKAAIYNYRVRPTVLRPQHSWHFEAIIRRPSAAITGKYLLVLDAPSVYIRDEGTAIWNVIYTHYTLPGKSLPSSKRVLIGHSTGGSISKIISHLVIQVLIQNTNVQY